MTMTLICLVILVSGLGRSLAKHGRGFALAGLGVTLALAVSTARGEFTSDFLIVSWKLIDNIPGDRFKSEITLRNDGKAALSKNWSLYFNSSSKLLPESVSTDYELTHVNGDLYVIRSAEKLPHIAPGDSRRISLEGSPWAINISDAPSGFYIVMNDDRGQPGKPVSLPIHLEPFPEASKLHRGAADLVPIQTAASRYIENESLTKLPPAQLVKVVPTPVKIEPAPGRSVLDASTIISCEPALRKEATFLADAIGHSLNGAITIQESDAKNRLSQSSIRLRIGDVEIAGQARKPGDDAYELTTKRDAGVEIVGTDPAGVFYGIQTLRSLLPIDAYREKSGQLSIEGVRIADAPRFAYRGLHLDVARNFQSKQTVKKLLDLMAFYKLNRLHLHLTDDEGWRIEIKQLPELTSVGSRRGHTLNEAENLIPSLGSGPFPDRNSSPGSGFYTQDDLIELLRYADTRHIAVIPEIDLPGHARAAVKSMQARRHRLARQPQNDSALAPLLTDPGDKSKYESVQLWRDNVVDVGREDTYQFVELVVSELLDIYKRAGVPLTRVHLGGDEVPKGAWEESPACETIGIDPSSKAPRTSQLELHFLNRASQILQRHSIRPACWEDCLLLEVDRNAAAGDHLRAAGKPTPTAYVWNNVWGWGREDAAYRLANAGFDVVLCNATHLYFDLACEKDPLEPGYYWASFVGMRAPFEFIPLDFFKNAMRTNMGQPIDGKTFSSRTRLTPHGAKHIRGIQGQLWGENLRNAHSLEYMGFPRIIALAERAWASSPEWAQIEDPTARNRQLHRDWNQFANRLGQRELPRLDYLHGGVEYRLPPPGAIVRDGRIRANTAFPGLDIRYTTGETEPDETAALLPKSIPFSAATKLKSFSTRGRGSRTVIVARPE